MNIDNFYYFLLTFISSFLFSLAILMVLSIIFNTPEVKAPTNTSIYFNIEKRI